MLEFIKENAVFCTSVVGIISALIAAFVTLIVNRNTEQNEVKLLVNIKTT